MGTNAKQFQRTIRQVVLIFALVAGAVGALSAYVSWASRPSLLRGTFQGSAAPASFKLEVRHTCQGRQEGLMFRRAESLPRDQGMLFIFPKIEVQRFWMRNTLIPLDMIFLDRNLTVVGVVADVPPLNEVARYVDEPSQYVVELNAGVAATSGIKAGSKLQMDGALPRPEDC